MKKTVFWIGAVVLVVGIIMFAYGYSTIQNLRPLTQFPFHLDSQQQAQWDLVNLLQPIGLGILVLGVIMLLYSLFVKKDTK